MHLIFLWVMIGVLKKNIWDTSMLMEVSEATKNRSRMDLTSLDSLVEG